MDHEFGVVVPGEMLLHSGQFLQNSSRRLVSGMAITLEKRGIWEPAESTTAPTMVEHLLFRNSLETPLGLYRIEEEWPYSRNSSYPYRASACHTDPHAQRRWRGYIRVCTVCLDASQASLLLYASSCSSPSALHCL